ncbi:MAG: phospho-sugar mutase, partial [Acidaminococcaceae bacterium]|nr:phospho-sugar mutase [Acidaminococcaceae bacterium]
GMLLTDYICARRTENGTMPKEPVVIKTIVTTDMVEQIASRYGVRTVNVLTGFKYIGEQIGLLEKQGKADSYIFGFEESYGYLSGSYVRDKDAVDAAFLICEMFCYYKTRGISLLEKLDELYKTHGYCLNTLYSYQFEGAAGFTKMKEIMKDFQTAGITEFGGRKVETLLDYNTGIDGLPKENVLKFLLEDHGSVVVRPSGTEPKLKTYITVSAADKAAAAAIEQKIVADLKKRING